MNHDILFVVVGKCEKKFDTFSVHISVSTICRVLMPVAGKKASLN